MPIAPNSEESNIESMIRAVERFILYMPGSDPNTYNQPHDILIHIDPSDAVAILRALRLGVAEMEKLK